MSLYKLSWVVLHCWVVAILLFKAHGDGSGFSVNFLKAPNPTTSLNSATFLFNVSVDGKEVPVVGSKPCDGSGITCKLDNGSTKDCGGKEVSYSSLQDGNHTFEVCSTASPGLHCSYYNWIVDTIPPTAYITSPSSVTNALNVSVNISFTEPCTGENGKQGFRCSSLNDCNLLVYGDGQVVPSSLVTLVPTRKYTLLVALSSNVSYGNVTLEMDNNFCSDTAGNKFNKSESSTFKISFNRTNLFVKLSSAVPEKLLQLDNGNMSLLATNNQEDLQLYLNFSQPVPLSYKDVLDSLSTTEGNLFPISDASLGNQRFGFQLVNIPAIYAMINISFDSDFISRKLGNPVSPLEPITFVYDARRPMVRLTTPSERTTQDSIPIWINFSKPVSGFNESCNITISGGYLLRSSFREIKKSSAYFMRIQADSDFVSVKFPENVTEDIYGNKNQPESLNVRHDSEPPLSRVASAFVTSTFGITCVAQGMLVVSSASLVATGAISSGASSTLMSDPATNLFLSLSHIQLIALSKWLPVNLPNEYYDYAKALEWSIPYFKLPWEKKHAPPIPDDAKVSSKLNHLEIYQSEEPKEVNSHKAVNSVMRKPSGGGSAGPTTITSENTKLARSQYFDKQESDGWTDFFRTMFWLAAIGGILILLHGLVILIIKIKWPDIRRDYGVLTFPRFEIFCIIVALPCICKASTGLIRGKTLSGVAVGTLLLGVVFLILLSSFLFILFGVTLGMLLLYDEDYYGPHEQRKWYLLLRRVTLGPVKSGEWSWKTRANQVYVTILGPLFEDMRGLRKYMLPGNPNNHGVVQTQDEEALGGSSSKRIIPSNGRTEEAESLGGEPQDNGDGITAFDEQRKDARAPWGNSKKNSDDISASNGKTEDPGGPADIPNKNGDPVTTPDDKKEDKTFIRKLSSTLRTYYILLEAVRQVILGILMGAYAANQTSKSPPIIMLTITWFLLFFLVFLRPFVSKRGLAVEIISVVCELGVFTLLLVKAFSGKEKSKLDTWTVILPFIAYAAALLNQCYALYKQIEQLDHPNQESFVKGLKRAFSEFFIFFLPHKMMESFNKGNSARSDPGQGGNEESGSSAARNRSSSTKDEQGMKQQRQPTKSLSSSSKQASVAPNDPQQD